MSIDTTKALPTQAAAPSPILRSQKIESRHLEKLAIVYIRQSSTQQVLENRESTARQYALVDHAKAMGWSTERILLIDQDQGQSGKSAEHRSGFQRLLAEVTMDHVGIVFGLEMSRLARSSKDWHHLLELCAIFDTLLADQDGVYTACDPNDRLLLGLKGTMSEVELHTMRNRLRRGALNKAQRGELFNSVPFGYVIAANGEVVLDPDEQAQHVVRMIFEKFEQLGAIYSLFHYLVRNNIDLPVRAKSGQYKGELDWRRPSLPTLCQMLHHPIYAGAYAYGRRPTDAKSAYGASGKAKKLWKPMEEWTVLIKDHLPAYITWDAYEKNQRQIESNRRGQAKTGVAGNGEALLAGLVVCGNCGKRLQPMYRAKHDAHYSCTRHLLEAKEQSCYGLKAKEIDELVSKQVLLAIEPASLELSLQATEDIEQEHRRLSKHWDQQLQRAQYDVDLAARRYRAVDPDNRLVASSLEKQWEDALIVQCKLQDESDRFQQTQLQALDKTQREAIVFLSQNIPELWNAESTTNADRKEIIRCIVERVVVHVKCDSEYVEATIHWKGGFQSQHEFVRPVQNYSQLRDFDALMDRLTKLREQGHTSPEIAAKLNAEGFSPPKRRGDFTGPVIYQLLKRRGLIGCERSHNELLGDQEWWIADLARELKMSRQKLRDWIVRGWLHGRKTPIQGYWIAWADADEVCRLQRLLAASRRGINNYTHELTQPKRRA